MAVQRSASEALLALVNGIGMPLPQLQLEPMSADATAIALQC